MARRGQTPRSDDAAGYIAWRRSEEKAAADYGDGPAPAAKVLDVGYAAEESTVWDWRRVVPSVSVWRAWLMELYGDQPGMAEHIASGALDEVRHSQVRSSRQAAVAKFHAEMIPRLAADLASIRGRRTTDRELSELVGASIRTVRRYRTD